MAMPKLSRTLFLVTPLLAASIIFSLSLSSLSYSQPIYQSLRHSGSGAKINKVRKVPLGFIGANFNPWEINDGGGSIEDELQTAWQSGIESIRFPLYWFNVQPYKSLSLVPQDQLGLFTADPNNGAPYNWSLLDRLMIKAATLGVSVMPTVMGAPLWADDPAYEKDSQLVMGVPADYSQFARFLVAAESRYKAGSPFWADRHLAPVKIVGWQIWNEPDHPNFWPQHPGEKNGPRGQKLAWAPSYLGLFNTASKALKAADPAAQTIIASLLALPINPMKQYYAAGGQNSFGAAATNMFTTPAGIISRMAAFRAFLNSQKNLSPIYLTEFTFLSGKGLWPSHVSMMIDTISDTAANVGKRAAAALTLFASKRSAYNLTGVYWYCWASKDSLEKGFWGFAGLRRYSDTGITDKPSLAQFRSTALGLEGR